MQFKHCTLELDGPVAVLKMDHQEVMNAEGGLHIIDNDLQCNPYSLSLDPTTYSLATMF